jgi:hypothetical protein
MIFFAVVDDLGQRELGGEIFVALFHLLQTVDHGAPSGLWCFGLTELEWEKARNKCWRRAPLEEGRDGMMESHAAVSILARKLGTVFGLVSNQCFCPIV